MILAAPRASSQLETRSGMSPSTMTVSSSTIAPQPRAFFIAFAICLSPALSLFRPEMITAVCPRRLFRSRLRTIFLQRLRSKGSGGEDLGGGLGEGLSAGVGLGGGVDTFGTAGVLTPSAAKGLLNPTEGSAVVEILFFLERFFLPKVSS